MSPRNDIELVENDIVLSNNDLVWIISDEQHIEDTIYSCPGWWKENFSDGVAIFEFLGSDGQEQILARLIQLELESDLYTCKNPQVSFSSSGQLIVQPNAN